jgi:hypothetical protein
MHTSHISGLGSNEDESRKSERINQSHGDDWRTRLSSSEPLNPLLRHFESKSRDISYLIPHSCHSSALCHLCQQNQWTTMIQRWKALKTYYVSRRTFRIKKVCLTNISLWENSKANTPIDGDHEKQEKLKLVFLRLLKPISLHFKRSNKVLKQDGWEYVGRIYHPFKGTTRMIAVCSLTDLLSLGCAMLTLRASASIRNSKENSMPTVCGAKMPSCRTNPGDTPNKRALAITEEPCESLFRMNGILPLWSATGATLNGNRRACFKTIGWITRSSNCVTRNGLASKRDVKSKSSFPRTIRTGTKTITSLPIGW